ncbi:MAG: hypothetical protein ACLSAP_11250 [Oscillospiraceae bacterium]
MLEELQALLQSQEPSQESGYHADGETGETQDLQLDAKLFAYLQRFVEEHHNSVTSYEFTSLITHAVNLYGKQIAANLDRLLDKLLGQSVAEEELPVYFTAYYALSIYYKHYVEVDGYQQMVKRYGKTFKKFPLHYEVLSGLYKRQDRLSDALECDRKAIRAIERSREGPHIGVCFSYASTVSLKLELGETLEEDIMQKALAYAKDAMVERPNYGKFQHVYGKLKLFRIKPESMTLDEVKAEVKECKRLFQRAIEHESNQTQDYFSRKLEFEASKLKADAILYHAQSYHDLQCINREIIEKMKAENTSLGTNFKEETEKANRKTEAKMLQLLALFTAVMSIILNSVYAAASQKDVVQSIFIILTMVACVVLIISCLFIFCPALAGSALKIGKPHAKSRRKPDNAPAGAGRTLLPSRAPFCIAACICIAAIACILFFSYRYTTNILPSIQAGAPGVSSSAAGSPSSGAAAP